MKKSQFLPLLLLATPLFSGAVVFTFPAQAATLSFSNTFLSLRNFNQTPLANDTTEDVAQIARSGSEISQVKPQVRGGVDFVADGSQTFTTINFQNQVIGEGDRYFGLSQVSGQSIGEFFVGANQVFSFNFQADLNLKNLISSSQDSSVKTFSDLSFFLLNETGQKVGNFTILGNLETNLANAQDNDFLRLSKSSNITFTHSPLPLTSEKENQESVSITLAGSFQQRFEQPTKLKLTASTFNKSCAQAPQAEDACVKVPEPSSIWALFGFMGVCFLSKLNQKLR